MLRRGGLLMGKRTSALPKALPWFTPRTRRRKMIRAAPASFTTRTLARSRFRIKTDSIASGRNSEYPSTFTETSDDKVLIANGLQPMLVWDGRAWQALEAGVPAPTTAPTIAASGGGTITGDYEAYLRFLDADGNPSNFSPISNEITATSNSTITYTNVEATTDARVARRQLLRRKAGAGGTYYVDVDTTDLGLTTFSSTRTDTDLGAQEAITLFTVEGVDLANRYGIPPAHKAFLARHNDRVFAAGERDYATGHVEVTYGSATVVGIGTAWTSSFVNRVLYVVGTDQSYTVSAVDVAAQTLTLGTSYLGATDKFALYAIRPSPEQARLIYWSEAGLSQAWPATNAVPLDDDGDRITGLFKYNSYLYITEERHMYRWVFRADPFTDGSIWPDADRGAINPRCIVTVNDSAFILDQQGIYEFNAGEVSPVGDPIQDIFRPRSNSIYKVNWAGKDFFHAAHFPGQETVRFFVSLSGTKYPRHALCYQYARQRWWIEEFNRPIGASCVADLDIPRTLVGSDAYKTFVLEDGTLDIATAGAGTVRGLVTSITNFRLSDTAATFATSGLVGAPVAIISGRGKGQIRRIIEVVDQTLVVDQPWLVLPSTSGEDQSTYQIGAIEWQWRTGWFRTAKADQGQAEGVEILFEPTADPCTFDFRQYRDHAAEPEDMGYDTDTDFVSTTANDPDTVIDMVSETADNNAPNSTRLNPGFVSIARGGYRERWIKKPMTISVELRGYSNAQVVQLYEMTLYGVRPQG